ncbi:YdaU family protein [Paludibacterium yongneupense]|uniref:YdaU family protein n=1 Tax=Paludibacterium yongneupense TaxID=400061 RepID=UPI00040C397D|nr:YdaU family protein [Paludibacterium yongneupense]
MNFYKRFMGDYARGTAHLSLAEHGAYSLLLDYYYATEKGLPSDVVALYRICRAFSPEEQQAVVSVAEQYFLIGEDGLRHNTRADEQIRDDLSRIDIARENGKRGGRPKKTKQEPKQEPDENPPGFENGTKQEPGENPAETQDESSPQPEPDTHKPYGLFVSGARGAQVGTPIPPDFEPDRIAVLKAGELNLAVDLEAQRFTAHYQARSETRADASAWQAQFRKWLLDQHQYNSDRNRVTDAKVKAATVYGNRREDQRQSAARTLGVGAQYLTAGEGEQHAIR